MRAGRADIDSAAAATHPAHRPRAARNDPVGSTTSARVLRAQELIGNRAVTHLLAIQRKMGFEFEDKHWHSWRATDGGNQVRTVDRKEVLHKGRHYQIEGEDTFAHQGATTIEIVTEPFEENADGVQSLTQAMDDVKRRVALLDQFAGKRRGPDLQPGRATYPMPPESATEPRFVGPDGHRFSGSTRLPKNDILLSGGTQGLQIGMQYTAGLALPDIPEALEIAGTNPHEPLRDSRRRKQVRQHLYRPADTASEALRSVGEAPGKASALVERLEAIPTYADALGGDQRDITGFLSALVLTVDRLQTVTDLPASNDYLKIRLPQMPRNNFVQMLHALPQAQRAAVENAPDALTEQLVALLREGHSQLAPDRRLIPPNRVTDGDAAARRAGTHVATLTVRAWIRGLARGTDYLSKPGMREWLQPLDIPDAERDKAVGSISSVAALESVDTRAGDGRSLFQFENRRVNPELPAGDRVLTMTRAATAAIEILDHFAKLQQDRGHR